jgi:hypothetical protein
MRPACEICLLARASLARRSAREWSDWDERHGRLSREGSGRGERERARYNGATGMSDPAAAGPQG